MALMLGLSLSKTLLQTPKFRAYHKTASVIICATPPRKGTSSGKPPQINRVPSPTATGASMMMGERMTFLHKPKNEKESKRSNGEEEEDHGSSTEEKPHQAATD